MSNSRKVVVTSALPYANNRPHVGHIAGAYLPADIYVRFLRLKGVDTKFICGSDDYGVAIMLTAQKEGKTPAEVARYYNAEQQKAFSALNIEFDIYSSTSNNPYHKEVSQKFFRSIFDKGFFEKQRSKQFYDQKLKAFLPDRFVKGICAFCGAEDQNGDQCENCGNVLDTETLREARSVLSGEPAKIEQTVEWLLDLSRFQGTVEQWLEVAKVRDGTKKFVKGLISGGLVKRSMTRDISWGIPVPLEDPDAQGKVLYVWFDAPIGYISNTIELMAKEAGDSEVGSELWQSEKVERYHFIGEDNAIFHCVIWIAMLSAEGSYKLPDGVIVNNFLNIQFVGQEEQKMSKSRGTAVFIDDYLEAGGEVDALRYYLTSVAPERARTAFRPDDLEQRRNSELADVLGNLVNRIVSFSKKNFGSLPPQLHKHKLDDYDAEFEKSIIDCQREVDELLESFQFKLALERCMSLARSANSYVDKTAPWKAFKVDKEKAETALAMTLWSIKALSILLEPFIPSTAKKIQSILGLSEQQKWSDALSGLDSETALGEAVILFPKAVTKA